MRVKEWLPLFLGPFKLQNSHINNKKGTKKRVAKEKKAEEFESNIKLKFKSKIVNFINLLMKHL